MVVGSLSKGPMRLNALLRLIGGVSHRMLILTLRGLEHDGLVKRTVYHRFRQRWSTSSPMSASL
jgi:DNA-binding HxlR family transcriptional regulator